ncbi:NADPH:quinone reductase-like Zn-dependent oxidoreductase [Peribacillus simplex]|nr:MULTISPECIES: zinc-binding dehydrogenase [Peribacillus]MDF9763232.1 NADPH:quinone reductase-like Zn-dependent oxidoreductase [Peribacillus simplex]
MILIGILGGTVVEKVNLMELLLKRVQLKGNLLTPRSDEYKKELTEEFASKAMPLFFQNEIRAIVGHVFPFEEIKRVHEQMEAKKNSGKIILQVNE